MNNPGRFRRLIEAALPLPEFNGPSAYDKIAGIGRHANGIHWWTRLPWPGNEPREGDIID